MAFSVAEPRPCFYALARGCNPYTLRYLAYSKLFTMGSTSQPVLSYKDSPLSVTGNVIGILTFVTAILISYATFFFGLRGAARSYQSYATDILQRTLMIRSISDKVSSCERGNSKDLLQNLLQESEAILLQAGSKLEQLEMRDSSSLPRLVGRIKITLLQNNLNTLLADLRLNDSKLCLILLDIILW